MRSGSGPTSITIAEPPPRLMTTPSPWPTSQFTSTQDFPGHPITPNKWITTAPTTKSVNDFNARLSSKSVTTSASAAPAKLFGTLSTGSDPQVCATNTTHPENGLQVKRRRCEIPGASGESSAAMKPIIVIGATTSATRKFAGSAIRLNCPEIAMISGVQKIVAAIGIAKSSTTFLWRVN